MPVPTEAREDLNLRGGDKPTWDVRRKCDRERLCSTFGRGTKNSSDDAVKEGGARRRVSGRRTPKGDLRYLMGYNRAGRRTGDL